MKLSIFLLVITLVVSSCGNDDSPTNTAITPYIGTWSWTLTEGGIGNNIHDTPNSSGHTYKLEIDSGYNMIIYKDNVLIAAGLIQISQVTSIYDGQLMPYIRVETDNNFNQPDIVISGIIRVEGATLYINDNNHDGVGSSYTKIN